MPEICPHCTLLTLHEYKMKDVGVHDFAKSKVARAVSRNDWKVVVEALAAIGAAHLASQLIHYKKCSNPRCGHFVYVGLKKG